MTDDRSRQFLYRVILCDRVYTMGVHKDSSEKTDILQLLNFIRSKNGTYNLRTCLAGNK